MSFTRFVFYLAVACAFLGTALEARAADPEWKVGVAAVKITPPQPVLMVGYPWSRPFEKVASDLFVKALFLEDRAGQQAVLITSDLVGLPASVVEPICERIGQKLRLKREQILLNSSHTHSGPLLTLNPAEDRFVNERLLGGEGQRTVEYTKWLQDQVVQAAVRAAEKREPAHLSWGAGTVGFIVNRRSSTPEGVKLRNNPKGPVDRRVPVLRIDGADGKLRAVLFGTAGHAVTVGSQNPVICGDFPGFAQTFVEEKHPDAVAFYMLGCAGDAWATGGGSVEKSQKLGGTLGTEVCRVLDTKLQPVRGPLKVAFDMARLPLQEPPPRAELEKWLKGAHWDAFNAKKMLAVLERGEKLPAHYVAPLAVWQLGKDLTLVALPGEAVVDYVALIEKTLGPDQLWIAAYSNDAFGYLPSRVLEEGGYETRGICFGGVGQFHPKTQDVVVEKIRELAKKAGRD